MAGEVVNSSAKAMSRSASSLLSGRPTEPRPAIERPGFGAFENVSVVAKAPTREEVEATILRGDVSVDMT